MAVILCSCHWMKCHTKPCKPLFFSNCNQQYQRCCLLSASLAKLQVGEVLIFLCFFDIACKNLYFSTSKSFNYFMLLHLMYRCEHARVWPAVGALTQASNANISGSKTCGGGNGWAGCCFYSGLYVFSYASKLWCKKYLPQFQVTLLCMLFEIQWLNSLVFSASS